LVYSDLDAYFQNLKNLIKGNTTAYIKIITIISQMVIAMYTPGGNSGSALQDRLTKWRNPQMTIVITHTKRTILRYAMSGRFILFLV
jgi:hypothetical protein